MRLEEAARIVVGVKDGSVDLAGAVGSQAQREGLVLLARRVEGVRDVKDNLVVRPPGAWGVA